MLLHQAMEQTPAAARSKPRSAALCAWCVARWLRAARQYRGFQ
jgi:hypothetical protein